MGNDLKENCVEAIGNVWNTQESAKRMRIFSNVFFSVVVLGIVAACVMLEIPYNLLTEIINEYKTNA